MATVDYVEYEDASSEVRDVYDDIMSTRKVNWINNFWKALAVQPELLLHTWESIKQVMAPGAIDAVTKEMIYIAVSATNGCRYCVNSRVVNFDAVLSEGDRVALTPAMAALKQASSYQR